MRYGTLCAFVIGVCSFVVADPAIGSGSVFSASITRALVPPRRDSGVTVGRYGAGGLQPEIIVNRTPQRDSGVTQGGYSYDPPAGSYLPPESVPFADEPPAPPVSSVAGNYLPPVLQEDIPAADEPVFGPDLSGEYLPPVEAPPQRDEVFVVQTTPSPGYNYNRPTTTTTSTTFAPLGDEGFEDTNDPGEGYRYDPPTNIYIPPSGVGRSLRDDPDGTRTPIRLQLNELACLRNSGGYFRAALAIQSALESVPLVDVENDGGDLSGCEVRLDQARLLVDIAWSDFGRCGVVACGQLTSGTARELCLRIRFPAIAGMRTAVDPVLTLQCRIQQRIVARTHSLRLGVANDSPQARSGSGTAFAVGGSQRPFRSQLGIFRRANGAAGAFSRALQPGGAVMLGEELMLRTQVSAGDGWNYTRLSEVVMQRLSPTGTVLNSASLVTTNGCLNPLMRAISPLAPVFEAPLGYRLGFRAAMFQGMRSGDEMIMRVRIVGCVDRRECLVENCATTARSKRDTETSSSGEETHEAANETALPLLTETASIAFRIMLPSNASLLADPQDSPEDYWPVSPSVLWITLGTTGAIVAGIGVLALVLMALRHKRRPSYDEYRSD
ncbi:uncharacterized protein LOC131285553 [Anopheles ziemanni]|uniref:uncharacterized protein LOC131267105 n=1 Tax=Anopheles coustani TaxID=139045 RepID=UPI0026589266|nr:uncharacterized protein LOC131267105 [Anopheles coustani]XP_058170394.1 uncharacterized protein LOC131285553 [Anopheles ziemanni]